MRVAFMGTPALAVPALEALREEHEIVVVVTQPDKPAGRGGQLTASPVKQWAERHGVAVLQPERARDETFVAQLRESSPEAVVVVAYGQILPRTLLELPPRGCINLHFSLLPRWRGAAPVQHAILAGDSVTGVTTQWMAEKLDAGDVILQQEVAIGAEETAGELLQRLTPPGARLLRDTLRLLGQGSAPRRAQDAAGVTLAPSLRKEDGRLRWEEDPWHSVNRVRAMQPWPVAWCLFRDEMLKVWRAIAAAGPSAASGAAPASGAVRTGAAAPGTMVEATGETVSVAAGQGLLRLVEVQASGRRRMSAGEWARGVRVAAGERLD